MSELLLDYLPLVIFIAVAIGIGLVLLVAPFLVAYKQPDPEKLPPTNAASMLSTTRA